jgi:uncharacterized protein YndB with AHSA1/START domain
MPAKTKSPETSRELVITRLLDAPRELVWEVCTQPEHCRHWWGPKDFSVPVIEMDVRVGGRWRAVLRSPEGQEYPQHGVCRELVPPERLAFTLIWDNDGPESEMLCTFTFRDRGGKTEMTFRKGPFTSAESQQGELEGWNECFDRLGSYVLRSAANHP